MDTSPITLCGSLSLHPVSLGAAMHRAGYTALSLPYTYVPFAVSDDLVGALRGMRALGIRGFGVSMPFKLQVIPLLDALDPLARAIGAVNTVVNDGGILTGYNTDAYGSARALSEVVEIRGLRVLLIGAGGAARAVGHALRERGAVLHIVNRTRARAETLASALSATCGGLEDLGRLDHYDAVVNAASAGMAEYGADSLVPESALSERLVVMDIVYKPVYTSLLSAAARRGARVIHGGRMLLYQAVRQFELYTGHKAPVQAMEAALEAQIGVPPSVR